MPSILGIVGYRTICNVLRSWEFTGGVTLHHVLKSELLEAMKDCLRDLENVKLISPADLDIIDEKRVLRHKIDELEIEEEDNLTA